MLCEGENCKNSSTTLVYNKVLNKIQNCCDDCTEKMIYEISPEYVERCPNCDCVILVN